jgi:3-hydroxyisobutyrate dehydrogenase-like beta-hydroxyacid dehydrogenase
MAKNLIAKYPGLRVYDIVEANLVALEEKGAKRCANVAELAGQCSTIITMLPATQHVASVLRGPSGIYANAKPGTLVIDCSTIDPVASRELSVEAEQAGHRMIDAPVRLPPRLTCSRHRLC